MILAIFGFIVIILVSNSTCVEKKKWSCILVTTFLFLLSISRTSYSPDIKNYISRYEALPYTSYQQLFLNYLNGILKDPIFYSVAKGFADIGVSSVQWINLISLLFAISVGLFLYYNVEKPYIGYLIVVTFYFGFTLSGIRQTVALSIALFAISQILKDRKILFCLLIVLASLFHSSALILFPMFWLSKLKIGKKQPIILTVSIITIIVFPSIIRSLVKLFAWNNNIESYAERTQSLSWSGFIIQLLLLFFTVFFRKSMILDEESELTITKLINFMTIGAVLQGCAVIVAEAFRVSYYFSICSAIAIPIIIDRQEKQKTRVFLTFSISVMLILYGLYKNNFSVLF